MSFLFLELKTGEISLLYFDPLLSYSLSVSLVTILHVNVSFLELKTDESAQFYLDQLQQVRRKILRP